MGKGIVEKLAKDYPLKVDWIGYELHPETPKEGVLVTEEFPDLDLEKMLKELNKEAAPYGIIFNPFKKFPNTQLALATSEFARENKKFEEFHGEIFKAYFTDGKDIGELQTILTCAEKVGLDSMALKKVLQEEKYLSRLEKARKLAKKYKVVGLPTFIINDNKKIVGIRPYQNFIEIIEGAKNKDLEKSKYPSCGINGCD